MNLLKTTRRALIQFALCLPLALAFAGPALASDDARDAERETMPFETRADDAATWEASPRCMTVRPGSQLQFRVRFEGDYDVRWEGASEMRASDGVSTARIRISGGGQTVTVRVRIYDAEGRQVATRATEIRVEG